MKKCIYIFALLFAHFASAAENCDLSEFRWQCDLGVRTKPTPAARSLIYCGNIHLYMSTQQYEILRRYQRAEVNMVLKINGEFITAPCVPYSRS